MEIGDEDIPYSCTASAEKKLCKMCRYYVINNKCCNVSWLRLLLTGVKTYLAMMLHADGLKNQ